MLKGIGTDLVDIARFRQVLERRSEAFCRRVFTPAERAYSSRKARPAESLAARFAAKEAVMKALGAGWGRVGWTDIEVVMGDHGGPEVLLHGRARSLAEEAGISRWWLSLTHTDGHALAVAVAETEERLEK